MFSPEIYIYTHILYIYIYKIFFSAESICDTQYFKLLQDGYFKLLKDEAEMNGIV